MSNKLLSFIHDGAVHIAPGTKILPADTFSKLIEASEVLEKVKEDAEQYRKEVVTEIEKEKELARQEGFHVGMEQWMEQITLLEKEIQSVKDELPDMIGPLAIKAAKKIVGREIEINKETFLDIIANSLKAVAQHQVITIHVHPSDFEQVDTHREKLRAVFDRLESLTVLANQDIEPGKCTIETEAGIINIEMKGLWHSLEQAIGVLMQQEESSDE